MRTHQAKKLVPSIINFSRGEILSTEKNFMTLDKKMRKNLQRFQNQLYHALVSLNVLAFLSDQECVLFKTDKDIMFDA
jgi:hypothetical protein